MKKHIMPFLFSPDVRFLYHYNMNLGNMDLEICIVLFDICTVQDIIQVQKGT